VLSRLSCKTRKIYHRGHGEIFDERGVLEDIEELIVLSRLSSKTREIYHRGHGEIFDERVMREDTEGI
jgi:hypothetical protein